MLVLFFSLSSLANQLNLVPLDTWGDKSYSLMVNDGTNVFVASDGVLVLDLSNPLLAKKKTKITIPSNETIKQLRKVDNYLYVMTGKNFYIIDIENIESPLIVTTIIYGQSNYWQDFVIKGDTLFIVGQDDVMLSVYDISDRNQPILNRSVPLVANLFTNSIYLALTEENLVVATYGKTKLLSLDENNFLVELYSDEQEHSHIDNIPVLGNTVYFADKKSIISYDFSNVNQVIKTTTATSNYSISAMEVNGTTLNVLGFYLYSFDLSTPSQPVLTSQSPSVFSGYYHLTNIGEYSYISSSESIQGIRNYTQSSFYSESVMAKDLSVSGDLLALAGESLHLFDVSSDTLESVYKSSATTFSAVALKDQLMYSSNMVINDISDLNNVYVVGSFSHSTAGSQVEQIINIDEDMHVRSLKNVTNFDLPTAITPTKVNDINTATFTEAKSQQSTSMAMKDNHFFVGTVKGLYHFYQDDSLQLQVIGQLGEDNWITEVEIVGDHLYVIRDQNLSVWNISDLHNPKLATDVYFPGYNVNGVGIYKSWLFIPSSNEGIAIIDISDPENASLLDSSNKALIDFPQDAIMQNKTFVIANYGQLKRFSVNEAPIITTTSISTDEDTDLSHQLTFINLEEDTLTFEITLSATKGSVSINESGMVEYQPNENVNGQDSFKVKIIDQYGGDSEKEISITINAINDAPEVLGNVVEVNEDTALETSLNTIDIDDDSLEFQLINDTSSGELILKSDGSYTYQAIENYNGEDEFTFSVSDGVAPPVHGVVSIIVNGVNDSPELNVEDLTLDEDSQTVGQASSSDIDGDLLNYIISSDPIHGQVTISTSGSYTYQGNDNFNGTDSFVVTVTDGLVNVNKTVNVSVTAVNDAPVVESMALTGVSESVLTATIIGSDIDGDTLTYTVTTNVGHGTLTLNESGNFSYQSTVGFSGSDSFTFDVSDSNGGIVESSVTFTISAKPTPLKDSSTSSSGGGAFGLLTFILLILTRRKSLR